MNKVIKEKINISLFSYNIIMEGIIINYSKFVTDVEKNTTLIAFSLEKKMLWYNTFEICR